MNNENLAASNSEDGMLYCAQVIIGNGSILGIAEQNIMKMG